MPLLESNNHPPTSHIGGPNTNPNQKQLNEAVWFGLSNIWAKKGVLPTPLSGTWWICLIDWVGKFAKVLLKSFVDEVWILSMSVSYKCILICEDESLDVELSSDKLPDVFEGDMIPKIEWLINNI